MVSGYSLPELVLTIQFRGVLGYPLMNFDSTVTLLLEALISSKQSAASPSWLRGRQPTAKAIKATGQPDNLNASRPPSSSLWTGRPTSVSATNFETAPKAPETLTKSPGCTSSLLLKSSSATASVIGRRCWKLLNNCVDFGT